MSIFSNFLNLFKYEPTTDAQNTFNIQNALNDNWDKLDDFAENVSEQLNKKADKESPNFTGSPKINGNEIATVNNIPTGLSLGETSTTAYRGDKGKTAYDHSQLAHAPSNAQKNSDITKAEIEAKLTGQISTHSHTSDGSKAPTNHASTTTAYGLGNQSDYGHCRLYNALNAPAYENGVALPAYQGKVLNDKITQVQNNVNNNKYIYKGEERYIAPQYSQNASSKPPLNTWVLTNNFELVVTQPLRTYSQVLTWNDSPVFFGYIAYGVQGGTVGTVSLKFRLDIEVNGTMYTGPEQLFSGGLSDGYIQFNLNTYANNYPWSNLPNFLEVGSSIKIRPLCYFTVLPAYQYPNHFVDWKHRSILRDYIVAGLI